MTPILQAEQITKRYGAEAILKGISLAIEENTFTAILGPSGSGKSTLLNVLSGMTRPTTGLIRCEDQVITDFSQAERSDWKRANVGMVFQNILLLNHLNAQENIQVGICPTKAPLGFDRLTRMLEIDDLLHKFPAQLSGGQQQRVAIARAVIKRPRLLFCDEATGSLDEANSKRVVELLHLLRTTFGVTVLFTTHNTQIARTANRVLTLKDGLLHRDVDNQDPIPAGAMTWGESI